MSSERPRPESGIGLPGGPAWNVAWSYAALRFTLGTTFLFHGVTRFVSGWSAFADQMAQNFHSTFLPDWMARPFALSVPPVEAVLGNVTDLGTFLFGQERASLDAYRPILLDVQKGICLYCQKPLSTQSQVDHFVPWSRYPADLGHNFVLAHDKCNNAKSDFLAAENHLAAWIERNREHQVELQDRLVEAALPCDLTASVQIAKWVYQQTEKANGQVWVMEKVLSHLSTDWSQCFAA